VNLNEQRLCCIFSYLGPFFVIGLFGSRRLEHDIRFHANQGLLLFILEFVLVFLLRLLGGLITIPIIMIILWIAAIVTVTGLSLRGILNASGDECLRLPVIGVFTIIKE